MTTETKSYAVIDVNGKIDREYVDKNAAIKRAEKIGGSVDTRLPNGQWESQTETVDDAETESAESTETESTETETPESVFSLPSIVPTRERKRKTQSAKSGPKMTVHSVDPHAMGIFVYRDADELANGVGGNALQQLVDSHNSGVNFAGNELTIAVDWPFGDDDNANRYVELADELFDVHCLSLSAVGYQSHWIDADRGHLSVTFAASADLVDVISLVVLVVAIVGKLGKHPYPLKTASYKPSTDAKSDCSGLFRRLGWLGTLDMVHGDFGGGLVDTAKTQLRGIINGYDVTDDAE